MANHSGLMIEDESKNRVKITFIAYDNKQKDSTMTRLEKSSSRNLKNSLRIQSGKKTVL